MKHQPPQRLMITGIAVAMLTLAASPLPADAGKQALTEGQKVETLIATVEKLKDARFIRNGSEYDCRAAADHMRRKRKAAGDKVKTARDFITHIASKSSRSGEPYKIKFKDGKEETSEVFLTRELDKLEGKVKGEQ